MDSPLCKTARYRLRPNEGKREKVKGKRTLKPGCPFHFSLFTFPFQLVRVDLRVAHDRRPFRNLRLDDGGELLGRVGGNLEGFSGEPLLKLRLAQDANG